MPASKSLNIYLPIAFVVVIGLMALLVANPSALFRLLNPLETMEKIQQQRTYAIGSEAQPLELEDAQELFGRYSGGDYASGAALVTQDKNNGLPEAFISELENLLIESKGADRGASNLIKDLAVHRPFDERVEAAYAEAVAPTSRSANTPPMEALARIGKHRLLTEPTLEILLTVAENGIHQAHSALLAMQSTARGHGLPDWVLDRLEVVARERRGTISSEAIKVLAVAGEKERAMAQLNVADKPLVDSATIALALPLDDLSQLAATLKDSHYTDKIRTVAFEQLIRRRDQSELVGDAYAYALLSERHALRLAAFASYSEWGRHHAKFISVSWSDVCAEAFDDDDPAMRMRAAGAFRFVPFGTLPVRDAFLLKMLHGSENQQLSGLGALASLRPVPESIKDRVFEMITSEFAVVTQSAAVVHERFRPKGRFEGLGSWMAGALFWALLLLPALTAVGFATYFFARLFQTMAAGGRIIQPLLVGLSWLVFSIGVGMLLFVGVLSLHGGIEREFYVFLLVVDVVFAALGWLHIIVGRLDLRGSETSAIAPDGQKSD